MSPLSNCSTTTVVVPCYNEAERLDLPAFAAFLDRCEAVSLLMVDDGSTDDTHRRLEDFRACYPARVSVYRSARNAGKAEAVRRGLLVALRQRPAFVGYWDADLATPLEAIPKFRDLLLERPELALVMGSRVALLGRQIRRRWRRHVLGRMFATAASLVLGLSVYDTQCGAKLLRVTADTAGLFRARFRSRWVFDVEILARMIAAARAGRIPPPHETIYEWPLERWQDVGGSRLKPRDFLTAAADLAAIYWQYGRPRSRFLDLPATSPIPVANEAAQSARREAA